jgi:hypothetical protein
VKVSMSIAVEVRKGAEGKGRTFRRVATVDASSEAVTEPVPSTLARSTDGGWPARPVRLVSVLPSTLLRPSRAGVTSPTVAFAGVRNSVWAASA